MTHPSLSPNAADALLFDLGRVVIDIDFGRALACWAGYAGCAPEAIAPKFTHDTAYKLHEVGAIGVDAYFDSLRGSLGIDLSDAQFLEGWNGLFIGEMPGIAPLLARAAERLPLYAFSNTNAAHAAHVTRHYSDVLSHFRELFLSSTIGLRKPDAAAFDHVVHAIGAPAGRIVFFDDLIDNVEAAQACGLIAVHVTSSSTVAEALAKMGLADRS